ncbi:MAG: alpha/beta hydrolase-fold protein [Chitinophagaceae bacterium]
MFRSFIASLLLLMSQLTWAQSLKINVHLDTSAHQPLTGRLYIFSVTDTTMGVQDPDPFHPSPTFYLDVKNWKGGEIRTLDSTAPAYPVKLSNLTPGFYKFAAILDIDTVERNNTTTTGNWYSRDVVAKVIPGDNGEVHLYLRRQIPKNVFRESDSIKEVVMKSKLLSAFHRQDIFIKAGIVLPAGYKQNTGITYPVVFIIPGWGGTHTDATGRGPAQRYGFGMGKEKIYVYLNPETQTRWGLHSFVDSRVNGPWGKSLVEEFIPYLATQYRINPDPATHFLVGQSSGGYGTLWLQLNYPKAFNGCWSVSPDPVDFSNFTSVNIYEKNVNMYYDSKGNVRPFFIVNGQPSATIKEFGEFEYFLGDGGQLQAFEAEFGLPDKNGRPLMLFDRKTGAIDPRIAKTWQPYDMGLFVLNNYKRLEKDLSGKVHVFAGADDNFFLNGAVLLFKTKAEKANAVLTAELIPGANHWSIWSTAFTQRVQKEIDERVR